MTASDVIAIVAMTVSGATLGWTMFRDMSDRGSLRVTVSIGNVITHGRGFGPTTSWYLVTNTGRRPIILASIGGGRDKKRSFYGRQA